MSTNQKLEIIYHSSDWLTLGKLIFSHFDRLRTLFFQPIKNILAVPLSAVMEDYENHFVFIRTSHETYEKRNVKLGISDGEKVQILMGVSEGEWVVCKGAYQIKMSSVSSNIPSHGHSH